MSLQVPSGPDSGLSRLHSEPKPFDAAQPVSVDVDTATRWKRKVHRIITTLERYDNQRAMRMLMELEADIKESIEGAG